MKELTKHHGLHSVVHQIFIALLLCTNHYYTYWLEIQQTEQDRKKAPASLMCTFSLGRQMIKMDMYEEEKRHLEIIAANKQGKGWKMNGRRSSYRKACVHALRADVKNKREGIILSLQGMSRRTSGDESGRQSREEVMFWRKSETLEVMLRDFLKIHFPCLVLCLHEQHR